MFDQNLHVKGAKRVRSGVGRVRAGVPQAAGGSGILLGRGAEGLSGKGVVRAGVRLLLLQRRFEILVEGGLPPTSTLLGFVRCSAPPPPKTPKAPTGWLLCFSFLCGFC